MVRAACQQRWGERKALLDGENYRLRREHVHAHHGEIGATYFSLTPNEDASSCYLFTINNNHSIIPRDAQRRARRVIELPLNLPPFSRFDLSQEIFEWPARERTFRPLENFFDASRR